LPNSDRHRPVFYQRNQTYCLLPGDLFSSAKPKRTLSFTRLSQ
jgi:hypothetical protein